MQEYEPDGPRPRRSSFDLERALQEVLSLLGGLGSWRLLTAAGGLLLVLVLWSSWFTVQPEETGVVQRFGAVVRTVGPGLHFKLPAGVEMVYLVPTARVLKEEFDFRTVAGRPGQRTQYEDDKALKDESLMLTGDLNVIDVQWIVQYRIEDPVRYLFQVRESRQTIRDIAEAVMRRIVGNRLGSDVLTVGRVAVSTEMKEEMEKILSDYGTGVRLVTVELQDVTPPDLVKPAFNEVNEARQDRERTINQAQEQANREIPKARGEAARTITEAEGHAVERVNRANGEATRLQGRTEQELGVDPHHGQRLLPVLEECQPARGVAQATELHERIRTLTPREMEVFAPVALPRSRQPQVTKVQYRAPGSVA